MPGALLRAGPAGQASPNVQGRGWLREGGCEASPPSLCQEMRLRRAARGSSRARASPEAPAGARARARGARPRRGVVGAWPDTPGHAPMPGASRVEEGLEPGQVPVVENRDPFVRGSSVRCPTDNLHPPRDFQRYHLRRYPRNTGGSEGESDFLKVSQPSGTLCERQIFFILYFDFTRW